MAGTAKSDAIEALNQLTYPASVSKGLRITEAAARSADHARDADGAYEEYLAAVVRSLPATRTAPAADPPPGPPPTRRLRSPTSISNSPCDSKSPRRHPMAS